MAEPVMQMWVAEPPEPAVRQTLERLARARASCTSR